MRAFRVHHSGIRARMTATLRQSIPLSFSLSLHPVQPSIPSSLLGPAPSNSPHRAIPPPYSSVLNATTRGTFLPSLFSLSSQCRFAGWRGEVVERERKRERKLERPGREKKKRQSKKCRRRRKEGERASLLVIGVPGRPQRGKRSRQPCSNYTPNNLSFYFLSSPFRPPRNRGWGSVLCFRFKRPSCPRSTGGTCSSRARE